MTTQESANPFADPFSHFWGEFVKWTSPPGGPPISPSNEVLQHLRSMFLQAMASQADQFMRSETFLSSMKQGMDNALAWQKAMNEVLQRGLSAAQVPSRADADHLVVLLRGLEERLLKKMDDLSDRVGQLEKSRSKPAL